MRMVLCKNGHFFDADSGKRCPVCGAYMAVSADDVEESSAPEELNSSAYETTVLTGGAQEPASQNPGSYETTVLTGSSGPQQAPNSYETTVLSGNEAPNGQPSGSYETTVLTGGENAGPSAQQGYTPSAAQIVRESTYSAQENASNNPIPILKRNADGSQYCYFCFARSSVPFEVCPNCGERNTGEPKTAIQLAPGTILQNRYIIGLAVGQGGFGIVYHAYDTKLEVVVAIKEYFPRHIVTRAPGAGALIITKKAQQDFEYFKKRFLSEARTMAKFGNHRSIPNVFEFFEENNTTYFVMEYLEGISLRDYIIKNGGHVEPEFASFVVTEIGNALKSLHKENIIHRDVAPDNIFICFGRETRVKLMDLGAAKLTDGTDDVIDRVMKPGFSPPEQYDEHGNVGPWTDIYALGATMYAMLTGTKPEESTNRVIQDNVVPPIDLNPLIPENLSNTIMKAMAIEPHMRFKNVEEMIKAVNGEKEVISLVREKKRRRARQLGGIFAGIAVILVAAAIVLTQYFREKSEEELQPADIEVWFALEDGSTEKDAMEMVIQDFKENYPDVTVTLKAIPADEYEDAILQAAKNDELPDLFESTDLPEEMLDRARDVTSILKSIQARDCLFLNQYSKYYDENKRLPLGISVPVAYVITAGASCIEYSDEYFKSISDFEGGESVIALDERCYDMLMQNFPDIRAGMKYEDFMDNEENESPVLLSSTMALNEVRSTLTNYEKTYVYYRSSRIHCEFTYEWSLGKGTENEEKAASRLLAWMLGNSYQSFLMITEANDGQLPVNETCFKSKIESKYLKPISFIYRSFVFER